MLFNSLSFLVFFPCVLLVWFVIPRKLRCFWLLLTSYYFYMCWNPAYALLLLLSTVTTYIAGILLEHFENEPGAKKAVVCGNLFINFGILFVFKYLDFFLDNVIKIGQRFQLDISRPEFNFLLPVGISFYIFQAAGYTIDVYRKTVKAEKIFIRYAVFVSFFPQLVAGPIERSGHFLEQLCRIEKVPISALFDRKRIEQGAVTMLYGYILKMMLADRAALFVDTVFDVAGYENYQGIPVIAAILLFTLQIYCDFAGYTYIAIGSAKIMGIELMENFDAPYMAVSIKDFWSRWHKSLTTWFRDYLYIPLGGNQKGELRKKCNILIVFVLSGLWHGAAWHYVAWGTLHGIMRIAGEMTQKTRDRLWKFLKVDTEVFSFRLWRRLFTFGEVSLAWTFFRAASLRQAVEILKNCFRKWNPWVLFDGTLFTYGLDAKEWNIWFVSLLLLILVDWMKLHKKNPAELFAKQNLIFKLIVFYVGIFSVIVFGIYGEQYDTAQFIYFQF